MNNKPLISVIIPIYEVEDYIHECIDSVINQTYKNLEIILVDDFSPDNCPQICDEYAKEDSRIKVIHKTYNSGLSVARNTGLEICSGEYVYFLDSDDYVEKDAIESLVSEAQYHCADIVFFDANIVGETNNPNYPPNTYIRKGLYSNPLKGIYMLTNLIKNDEYRASVCLYLIRKEILDKNQLSFYPGIIHEDELFTFKLFLISDKIVHLPEPLYNRRIRDNSTMTSRIGVYNFISFLTIVNEMIDFYLAEVKSDSAKNIVKIHINNMLNILKNIYYQLPLSERIALYDKYKILLKKLESNVYLNNRDFKEKKQNIILFDVVTRKIKKILPKRAKEVMKRALYERGTPYSNQILNSLKEPSGNRRIILIGTPIHGNLGDHAIAIAEVQLISEYIKDLELIEIVMPLYRAKSKKIKRFITKKDMIIISGGGWLGNIWQHNENMARAIINDYSENQILIMPQTVYFDGTKEGKLEIEKSKKIYSSHSNLTICLRDLNSYNFVLNNRLIKEKEKCLYVPDAALALNYKIENQDRRGAMLCFRQDREEIMDFRDRRRLRDLLRKIGLKTKYTTNVYLHQVLLEERAKVVEAKLKEYASSQIVVTDRLHGMIFAAITGTPCLAFNNLTGKVQGVYDWIKNLEYIKFVSSIDEVKNNLTSLLDGGPGEYDNTSIREHFQDIFLNFMKSKL